MRKFVLFFSIIILLQKGVNGQGYLPTYILRADIEEDIKYLKEKLTKIHPKFLNTEYKKKWEEDFEYVYNNLPDSLTFNETFIRISVLLSNIEDGHTNFAFPSSERIKYMKHGGVTMPFTIYVKQDGIFMNEYFGGKIEDKIKGAEILSINSIDSEEILKKMRTFYGSKSKSISDKTLERYFGIYFWMLFGELTEYKLLFATPKENTLLTIEAVNRADFFKLKNEFGLQTNQKPYELKFENNNDFAIMKIKTFSDDKSLSRFLDYAFDSIKHNNCRNLIIDVRDNFGGRSNSVDSLLNYLTCDSYSQYSSISLRVSNEVKNYYKERKPDTYNLIADIPIDTLFIFNDSLFSNKQITKLNFFSGNIYVLINDRTYSAAATFAGIIKNYNLGKIVGQATGGTIRYYGDFMMFRLPNTNIDFFISPKEFVQFGGGNFNEGVIPDILLNNLTMPEIIAKCH